jgi:hypothetical protein
MEQAFELGGGHGGRRSLEILPYPRPLLGVEVAVDVDPQAQVVARKHGSVLADWYCAGRGLVSGSRVRSCSDSSTPDSSRSVYEAPS